MTPCDKLIFDQITPDRLACLSTKLEEMGILLDGPSGQASKSGVTIAWNFDAAGQILEIQCLDTPFFLSCNFVNDKIREFVSQCP